MRKYFLLVLIFLSIFCCTLLIISCVCYNKINSEIKELKETVTYLETALETLITINKLPEEDYSVQQNRQHTRQPLIFDNSGELEKRIQNIEYQTRQQQEKIRDTERDTYWARSNAYWQGLEQEKLQKENAELKRKQEELQNKIDYPFLNPSNPVNVHNKILFD